MCVYVYIYIYIYIHTYIFSPRGVTLVCADGKITIDNTIDARLHLIMEQALSMNIISGAVHIKLPYEALNIFHAAGSVGGVGVEILVLSQALLPQAKLNFQGII